jgi:AcrR family transcriptional regulator
LRPAQRALGEARLKKAVAQPSRLPNGQKPGKSAAAVAKAGRSRGRPPVISTERLLEVARQVFLELGIRATTAEVAARAGIAEGTIFHRFKSKEELFRAAMNFDPDTALQLAQTLSARAGQGDLRETLIEFAERFMEFGRAAMPVMMMSWSNPEGLCAERSSERATRYHKVVSALAQYFDAEMRGGRMRKVDSEVVARMLLGSLHHYCMIELFVGAASERLTHHEFAQHVVDTLLASPEATK